MSREILVMGDKTFKISVPDEAKLTFGPWSPANDKSTSSYSSARA